MKSLIRAVRQSLAISREGLAFKLGTSASAIGHWETGRTRPHPKHLKQMIQLAPAFAAEIEAELRKYEWHPRTAPAVSPNEVHELPADIGEKIERLAKKHGLDTSVIILQALRTGLAALSRDSSPDLKTLVRRQADIARRVHDREQPAESSRKRPRSKIA